MSEADQPKREPMLPRWLGFGPQDKQADQASTPSEPEVAGDTWPSSEKSEHSSLETGELDRLKQPALKVEQVLPPKLDLTGQSSDHSLHLMNFGSEFPDLPESLTQLMAKDSSVSELVSTVQQRYSVMHDRAVDLDQTLKQHQKSLALLQARSQNQEALLSQQSRELGVSHQHAERLMAELESANETAQRQQALVENLAYQLEAAQNRINQLEAAQIQVQSGEDLQAQRLAHLETTCTELRSRLQRQQRYTLQFKAALEKCLEQPGRRVDMELFNPPKEEKDDEVEIALTDEALSTQPGLLQENRPFLFGDDEIDYQIFAEPSGDSVAAEVLADPQTDDDVDSEFIFSEGGMEPDPVNKAIQHTQMSLTEVSQVDLWSTTSEVDPSSGQPDNSSLSINYDTNPSVVFTSEISENSTDSLDSVESGLDSAENAFAPPELTADDSDPSEGNAPKGQTDVGVDGQNSAAVSQASAITADFLFDRLGSGISIEGEEDLWANLAQIIETPSGVPAINSFICEGQDLDAAISAVQPQQDTWLQTNPLLSQDGTDVSTNINFEGLELTDAQSENTPRTVQSGSQPSNFIDQTSTAQISTAQTPQSETQAQTYNSFNVPDQAEPDQAVEEPAFTIQDSWPSPTILPRQQVQATPKKRASLASVKLPSFPRLQQ